MDSLVGSNATIAGLKVRSSIVTPELALASLLSCVVFSAILAALISQISVSTNGPPGPKPWPVVGNLFFLARLFKSPEERLIDIAKKYGSLCMLWFGSSPVLVINTAEDIKQLLDKVRSTSLRSQMVTIC